MNNRYVRLLRRIVALSLIAFGLFFFIGIYYFSRYLRPRVISISQSYAENMVSNIIDNEIQRLMLEEFLSYDKITLISRDNEGRVTSISANSVLINNFANDLDIIIGDKIDNADIIENKVYLFGLIGADWLAGMGPKVPIRFQPISVTHADVSHTFEETGINQTLHTINLKVWVEIEILFPLAYSTMTVESEMPIAQTLIVGTVPNAYFNKK
ncbi:MAG: sporulation protein YunB [Clostridia bacterium]|nr:sporulation protein YunB [Clostridia bacterium]